MKSFNSNIGILIMRLSLGGLMLLHGIGKLIHGLGGIESMLKGMGLPAFLSYGVLVGELIAPILIIIGLRTRLASLIFAFNMLVAIFMAHGNELFSLNAATGGLAIELPALYLLGAVSLVFTGAGKYAMSSSSKFD